MFNNLIIISEALRIFKRNISVKRKGFERFEGSDIQICKKIVDSCYNGRYIQTSLNNYRGIYCRDFGICIQSLMSQVYRDEIKKTLKYMLDIFEKKGIHVVIDPKGRVFNFPNKYSPDSVAYFFRSLRIFNDKSLIEEYKHFLNLEIHKFEDQVIDKEKGIIKRKSFSGMRDHEIVISSCYDMIMACMLSDEIDKIGEPLINPFKKYDLKKNLVKHYWNGRYFKNSLTDDSLTGHCNTFPYWLDIIHDRKMLKSSLDEMQKLGLDRPFPLKYGHSRKTRFIWQEMFVKDWEKDTIWAFLGLPFIDILSRIDKDLAKKYLDQYTVMINRYHAFIEVYDNYKPYSSTFYSADTGMIWASLYLDLKKKLR